MILKWLLFPFSILYNLITKFRNHLYNINTKKSFQFEVATLCIGNLSVGGTGKTPLTEYCIQLLKDNSNIATLSRGYGRTSKGFILASSKDTAKSIGDEPLQYFSKFSPDIAVSVGEERAMAIPSLLLEKPSTNVILLDDAFQHRKVQADFSMLTTTFQRPFFKDYLLPMGRLRESRKGANRANCIVVTKCPPTISIDIQREYEQKIQQYAPKAKVFFSSIQYGNPVGPVNFSKEKKIFAFAGIGNPTPFFSQIEDNYTIIGTKSFPDHYSFSQKDLENMTQLNPEADYLMTTEKDYMRLLPFLKDGIFFDELPVFYIPINFSIKDKGNSFDQLILQTVDSLKMKYKN